MKTHHFEIGYGNPTQNEKNDPRTEGLEMLYRNFNDVKKYRTRTLSTEPEPQPFGPNYELEFGFGTCLERTKEHKHMENPFIPLFYGMYKTMP